MGYRATGNPRGRPRGGENPHTARVRQVCESIGCDPVRGMALILMDESAEPMVRARCAVILIRLTTPSARDVELNRRFRALRCEEDDDGNLTIRLPTVDERLEAYRARPSGPRVDPDPDMRPPGALWNADEGEM